MYLRAGDTISGQEARATMIVDGIVHPLFFAKSLEARLEKEKIDIKTLGKRSTQKKTVGWTGSGSFSLYYVSSLFREMVWKYAKQGKDTYFDITVTNEDPTSTIGSQTVLLTSCNIDSSVIAKLDVDSQTLDEDFNFTFDGFEILSSFNDPAIL